MRARDPDRDGFADHDGTRVFYEVYGAGEPTLVLVPSNPIVDSRQWKAQVPYLSRHYRVVAFDGRGNGRSDRPEAPEAYTEEAYVAELAAVLEATGSDRVVLVGLCHDGVWRSLRFAANHPERVAGIVAISVGVPLITHPTPSSWRTASTRSSTPTRAGPNAIATPGGATTAGSSSSSSPRCSPAPLDHAGRALRGLGPGDQRGGHAGLDGRPVRAVERPGGGDLPAGPGTAADHPRRR
jgi:pimeloyl-ACP methyl ester carboxylesterase